MRTAQCGAMSNNMCEYHLHCATRSCYSCAECKKQRQVSTQQGAFDLRI
jgi:hypothetical protein